MRCRICARCTTRSSAHRSCARDRPRQLDDEANQSSVGCLPGRVFPPRAQGAFRTCPPRSATARAAPAAGDRPAAPAPEDCAESRAPSRPPAPAPSRPPSCAKPSSARRARPQLPPLRSVLAQRDRRGAQVGPRAALAALAAIDSTDNLRLLAREQRLSVDADVVAAEMRAAIVMAAERRIANRMAAAS